MQTILVAIDSVEGTAATSPVIQTTVRLAKAFSSKVWLVHVVPRPGATPFTVSREVLRDEAAGELHNEHKHLQRLAQILRERGIDAAALLVEGPTVKTLLTEANRLGADLLVVGRHKHSALYRALLDHTEERLLNESSQPILFVPAPPA